MARTTAISLTVSGGKASGPQNTSKLQMELKNCKRNERHALEAAEKARAEGSKQNANAARLLAKNVNKQSVAAAKKNNPRKKATPKVTKMYGLFYVLCDIASNVLIVAKLALEQALKQKTKKKVIGRRPRPLVANQTFGRLASLT